MQVLHITFLHLFPLWSVMPGCSVVFVIPDTFQLTYASCSNLYLFITAIYECIIQLELWYINTGHTTMQVRRGRGGAKINAFTCVGQMHGGYVSKRPTSDHSKWIKHINTQQCLHFQNILICPFQYTFAFINIFIISWTWKTRIPFAVV